MRNKLVKDNAKDAANGKPQAAAPPRRKPFRSKDP